MEEPEKIIEVLERFFAGKEDLKGRKVMITAGPTYEKIDPVRFIGNYSSGKMGYALAEVCAGRGAEVTLVSGPVSLQVHHPNIHRINVESAEEMYQAATAAMQMPMQESFVLPWLTLRLNVQPTTRSNVKRKIWCCG